MKKFIVFICIITFFITSNLNAQGFTKPSDGKAVIYIVHTTAGLGTKMIFDENKLIGTLKTDQYLRYECEPGEHIFTGALGVGKGYLTTDFEAGKIYIARLRVPVKIRIGVVQPSFTAVDFSNEAEIKKMTDLVDNQLPTVMDPVQKEKWAKRWEKNTAKGITNFKTKLKKKNKHAHISADMDYKI